MSLLQYMAQVVALLGVYDDTFLSIHHIVIHIILEYTKRPPVSEACLSAIEFKTLILPFKAFVITRLSSFNLGRIVKSERIFNQPEKQYNP